MLSLPAGRLLRQLSGRADQIKNSAGTFGGGGQDSKGGEGGEIPPKLLRPGDDQQIEFLVFPSQDPAGSIPVFQHREFESGVKKEDPLGGLVVAPDGYPPVGCRGDGRGQGLGHRPVAPDLVEDGWGRSAGGDIKEGGNRRYPGRWLFTEIEEGNRGGNTQKGGGWFDPQLEGELFSRPGGEGKGKEEDDQGEEGGDSSQLSDSPGSNQTSCPARPR